MRKNKLNLKITALTIIFILLFSSITPFLSNSGLDIKPKEKKELVEKYLYLSPVTETEYDFSAKGACYIIVDIVGIAFTSFILDDGIDQEIYEVSYGLNMIPIEFPQEIQSYIIRIEQNDLQYFNSLTVEPLFLAEDKIEVSMDQDTEINFYGGGPVSILTRIDFSYNWLYVELQNETDGSTLLKRIQDTDEYPEVDPLFYCLFIERGTYIRFDVNLQPGEYTLILRGDGFIEYKILVNSDWDEDLLDDVDEVQQEGLYDFDLDPTSADIWGFYEKSSDNQICTRNTETNFTEGFFTFYIPERYSSATLAIRFNSGEFKEIAIDGNYTFFQDDVFKSDLDSPPEYEIYGDLETGWHSISYLYISNFTADIDFLVNYEEINVLLLPEMLDSDGDGFKDFAEITSGLNSSKIDTDEDGLPDNFDSSPLAKSELDHLEINQIIVPTSIENNTIINLFIKKPINDYSTYGIPRYWNNVFNVSITPVLRLFGNKFNTDQDTKQDMDRAKLIELWGKNVSLKFKSDVNYDETQIGDPLPIPDDPDNEYYFVFPKSAETNFEYDITIPKEHGSKSDGFLDLRFDFIWLVTKYDHYTNTTTLLHFYEFEEDIIIQSMTLREFSNVEYLLGSPDNFIENQILWTLTQNPSLGTPEDYNVDDDIIGNGKIDYLSLPERLLQDKANSEEEINQTEVLYLAGLYQNYDILNKIAIQEEVNPPFERVHSGDFEAFFSYYTIGNVYTDQNYTFGDLEIQGENKILYQTYYANLSIDSSVNVQKRASIMGIPISMIYANSKVLKIKQAQGANIPLEEISSIFNSKLSENIIIIEQTYIEQNDQNQGIPLLNFQVGVDIYKEFIDNRQNSVVLSDLFFTYQPYMPAEALLNFTNKYYEQIESLNDSLHLLKELILSDPNLNVDIQLIENMLNDIDVFTQQHTYLDLSNYASFFSFGKNLMGNFDELLESFDLTVLFEVVSPAFFAGLAELAATTSEAIVDQLAEKGPKVDKINQHKQDNNKMKSTLKSQGRIGKLTAVSGATCAILGIVMMVFTLVEIFRLIGEYKKSENASEAEFAMEMCSAVATLALGSIILIKGIILLSMSSVKEATVASLKAAGKVLGVIGIVLSIFIVIFDWVKFAMDYSAGDIYDLKGALFDMIGTTVLAAVGIIISLFASGIGAAFGIIAGGLLILGAWLSSKINNPSIDVIEENCKIILPTDTKLNLRRHGGLEVGDEIGFSFHVVENGDTVVYMRARFRLFSESWVSVWDGWHGEWDGYCSKLQKTFYAEIMDVAPDVGYQLQFEMDWQKFTWYVFWFSFSREEGVRQTITEFLGMPALENSISEFYANTHEVSTLVFKQLYEKAVSEYKYKDATYAAINVMRTAEELAGISENSFSRLCARLSWYSSTLSHLKFTTTSQNEYIWYLTKFISEGIVPLALILYFIPLDDLMGLSQEELQDLLPLALTLYSFSAGILLVPVGWVNSRTIIFNDYHLYSYLYLSLPFHANCRVNMTDNVIKINPNLGYGEASLEFDVDWYHPWLKPLVDGKIFQYKIIAPEGFSIGPQDSIYDGFPATLNFYVIQENPDLIGTFEFILLIYLDSNLVYQESLPFYIVPLYKIELIIQIPEDPIVPGQFFNAIYVNNTGNLAVRVNVSVAGIPDNFIYKDLYPNVYYEGELVSGYIDNTLIIGLNPGEVKEVFIIHPPRHYTTAPGPYTYTVHVEDHEYGNFDYEIIDTFIVAEFYDIDFQCFNPDITIFDNDIATYTFNLTNLGNVDQKFTIYFEDVLIANEFLSITTIPLEPGGWETFTLALDPTDWGNQEFNIQAVSNYSTNMMIELNITINDDDINPPIISNFQIIDTPIDITIIFEVLNEVEGDDCGLSEIFIYISGILVVNISPPDPLATHFSFTIDDNNGEYEWFMELGFHFATVVVYDNDDDVDQPEEKLSSAKKGWFETTFDDMREYVKWNIDNLKEKLQTSSDEYWRNPLNSHKETLDEKLNTLKHMIDTLVFLDAYNKMLHDIKTKLTGLKTDENENPWGNGVFTNPWVENNDFQESLRLDCNELLLLIQILMSVS